MVLRDFNASRQSRTGVLTEVFEDIEQTSNGFRSISKTVIPFARSKTITFTAKSMKPFTKLHLYFDKQVVNNFVTPASSGAIGTTFSNFSDVATPVAGSTLISDGVGNCNGTFTIPNPRTAGNPKFPTGNLEMVLTADLNNKQVGNGSNEVLARQTYAEAQYSATGTLDTQQETIISTRNAIVKTTQLTGESGLIVGAAVPIPPVPAPPPVDASDPGIGEMDPLAQTFIVLDTDDGGDGVTGAFLTSCDIFSLKRMKIIQ